MTKEEFLQSFDDNALLQEIDLLTDMVGMFASGASNDQVEAKYGFIMTHRKMIWQSCRMKP